MVNVLVNGIGTIGKRVAHAVLLQDDMSLSGVCDASPNSIVKTNLVEGPLAGVDFFVSDSSFKKNFVGSGLKVKGTMADILKKVDIVIDCTPAGVEAKYKLLYKKKGVKMIFQGGGDKSLSPISFNAVVNYDKSFGVESVRVVSCNTTSLVRTIYPLMRSFGVDYVNASLVRRAVDPWDCKEGPINSIVPVLSVPSHHALDVQEVIPSLNIITQSVKVPSTLAHVHMVHASLRKNSTTESVKELWECTSRVKVLDGFKSTGDLIEHFRDIGRLRYDMPEVVVFGESVKVIGRELYWTHAVHSESIIVPENIDAVRSMCRLEKDGFKSIIKTDKSLRI